MLKIYAIIIVVGLLGTFAYGAKYYYDTTQATIATLRENNAQLEVAVQTAEASVKTLQEETLRLGELNTQLSVDLQKAEQYGDELRNTLQRHNLTHLASKKPGLIEKRMQGATDKLWDDLADITNPDRVLDVPAGTESSNSNKD
jgi:FtsZ-binding cell division protein ZapB